MSLLIHGTKLPRSNTMTNAVIRVRQDGTAEIIIHYEHKSESFKLTEVPTPHGRLIDADTVEKRLQKYWYEEYPNQEASYHRAFMDSNACVKDLPTIIEAEVSEE